MAGDEGKAMRHIRDKARSCCLYAPSCSLSVAQASRTVSADTSTNVILHPGRPVVPTCDIATKRIREVVHRLRDRLVSFAARTYAGDADKGDDHSRADCACECSNVHPGVRRQLETKGIARDSPTARMLYGTTDKLIASHDPGYTGVQKYQ